MRKLILVSFGLFFAGQLFAQPKQHKIVFDFTRADTASFSVMIRHAKGMISRTSNPRLEIVCHGPGLDLLVKANTTMQKEIQELHDKHHVVFAACEVTMQRRGIDKSQLVPGATTVPAAILEISTRQQEGWSYIKE